MCQPAVSDAEEANVGQGDHRDDQRAGWGYTWSACWHIFLGAVFGAVIVDPYRPIARANLSSSSQPDHPHRLTATHFPRPIPITIPDGHDCRRTRSSMFHVSTNF